MKLFYSPGACSLSPHIIAREAGLDVQLVKVDLRTKVMSGGAGDFRAVNPKGQVPTLQLDDGQILTEGPAIVQYLADQRPDTGLVPAAGTFERYREVEWLNFVSTELHKQFSPLFNPKTPAEWKAHLTEVIGARFDHLSRHLEARSYLLGETFTAADAYLFVMLRWAPGMGLDLSARWPVLDGYAARIAARPAVKAALEAEGLRP